MINLPETYAKRTKKLLGDEYDLYLKAMEDKPVKAFRVNTDKISLEDFEKVNKFSTKPIPYVENGFYFDYEKIGNHPYHHAGMIYVQEPGAMAPGECLNIEKDWKILDMCASPGGKSTQLKNKLGEKGVLVSNEIIPSRCKILTGNIERLGLKNTVVTCMDTKKLTKSFPKTFDMIMVDAPCSGEGMFRKEPIALEEWSQENVLKCAQRQKEILENATKCLKDNGYIVYATCTFSLEENEMVIDDFLSNHTEFELLPVRDIVKANTSDGILFEGHKNENLNFARRFYPHKSSGEGQFMALLHNKNQFTQGKKDIKKEKPLENKILKNFLDDVLVDYNKDMVIAYKDNPVYFTPDFKIQNATVFMCGVTIGEIKKNYVQPHHQFFMAMGKEFKRQINLTADSEEIKKFLHGEEFNTTCENGWASVLVDGCTVGGVKVVNGTAKNHYPKGLRTKY